MADRSGKRAWFDPGLSGCERVWVYRFCGQEHQRKSVGAGATVAKLAPADVPVTDRSARVAPQQSPILWVGKRHCAARRFKVKNSLTHCLAPVL